MKTIPLISRFFSISFLAAVLLSSCHKKKEDPLPQPQPQPNTVILTTTSFSGKNQVPATTSSATGTFSGSYDKDTKVLSYNITYSGVTPTGMHIHNGAVGNNGGVVFDLGTSASPVSGTVTLSAADETNLLAGNFYVNIHSSANPNGDIRAQILTPEFKVFTADITEKAQVPATASAATGILYSTYNTSTKVLSYTIVYSGMTPSGMHIHAGLPGNNGGVVFDLGTPSSSPVSGTTVAFSTTQEADLFAGKYYVNIHSASFSGGEIRGQLLNDNLAEFIMEMSGSNQSPANSSTATGTFYGLYNKTTNLLDHTVVYSGMTPTGMHIHSGAAGNNGPVVFDLGTPSSSPASGTTPAFSNTQETSLLSGELYVNVHSAAYPDGEIRGQIE